MAQYFDAALDALMERADHLQHTGGHADALPLLEEVISARGYESGYAMAARAHSLFELDRAEEARTQLNELRKHRPFAPTAFQRAGLAMYLHSSPEDGARWYTMGLSRCTDQLDAGLGGAEIEAALPLLAAERRSIRRELGQPADDWDQFADAVSASRPHTGRTLLRVLIWRRDQVSAALEMWPERVDPDAIRQRELANRQLLADGDVRIVLVVITLAEMLASAARTGGDPLDAVTRNALLVEKYDHGEFVAWPPERNDACWCASGFKYKKCCGIVDL